MQKLIIILGVVAVVLSAGYIAVRSNSVVAPIESPTNVVTAPIQTNERTVESSTPDAVAQEPLDPPESTAAVDEVVADTTPGTYTVYDAAAVANSDADHILLFFHASWCPSCRVLDADITQNSNNIPPGVEIYKLDYDTATDLKRQYGVTTQHSVIEINAAGVAQSSISHPRTLAAIVASL